MSSYALIKDAIDGPYEAAMDPVRVYYGPFVPDALNAKDKTQYYQGSGSRRYIDFALLDIALSETYRLCNVARQTWTITFARYIQPAESENNTAVLHEFVETVQELIESDLGNDILGTVEWTNYVGNVSQIQRTQFASVPVDFVQVVIEAYSDRLING